MTFIVESLTVFMPHGSHEKSRRGNWEKIVFLPAAPEATCLESHSHFNAGDDKQKLATVREIYANLLVLLFSFTKSQKRKNDLLQCLAPNVIIERAGRDRKDASEGETNLRLYDRAP